MITTNLTLSFGSHKTREKGMCLMEAVALLAGEEHSDFPECACPILAAYARVLNDHMGEDAEGDALRNKYLLPLVKKLIGTRSTPEVEVKRVYFLTDQAIRVFAPLALEETGLTEIAETLRALPKTIGPQTADQAAFVAHSAFASVASAYAIATTAVTGITAAKCATDATTAKDAAYAAAIAAYEAAADADPTYTAAETATEAARIAVHAVAWEQAAQVLAEACEITVNEHEE